MKGYEKLAQVSESTDYENSVNKLLLHTIKCQNIMDIALNKRMYDPSLPICIELHLTNVCNLNCDWCIDKNIRCYQEEIPLPSLIRLLENIKGSNIGITIEGGGEPTMHKCFDEFISECYKRNISIGLITNGTKHISKELLKCFNFIRVSIDASTPEEYLIEKGKDYFYSVIDNLRHIRENNKDLVLGLSYVLNNRNYKNLNILFNELRGIDINFLRLRNVEENENLSLTESMMEEVKQTLDKYCLEYSIKAVLSTETQTTQTDNNNLPCIAHSLRAMINATGDVFLCSKRRHDPIVIGNINSDDFLDVWNSDKRIHAAMKLLDKNNQKGCSVCRVTKYNELFLNVTKVKSQNFI